MKLLHKTFNVPSCKVLSKEEGIIEAIVSVFNNVDSAKERVRPGFFKDSLEAKTPKGVWMHDWTLPVAKTLEAKELMAGDPLLPEAIREYGGLYIKGQFNLDTQRGKEAFSDLAFGTVDEFSFGYQVTESEKDAKTGINDLIKGDIYEWSPVLVGCNPATALISAKDAKFKSQYLGDFVEGSMTLAALRTLNDALFYNVVYDCVWNSQDLPLEVRLVQLSGACDEFRDLLLQVVQVLMALDKEEAQVEAKSLRVLWDKPEQKDLETFLLTGKALEDEHSYALTAVETLKGRLSALKSYRAKQGRTLSQTNRDRLSTLIDSLSSTQSDLQSLLDEADAVMGEVSSTDEEAEKAARRKETQRLRTETLRLDSGLTLSGV